LIPPAVAVRALRSTAPVVVKYFILVEKRMSRVQKKVTTKKSEERKGRKERLYSAEAAECEGEQSTHGECRE
jgi:hypothetical protein